jgi:hypothetical protein
MLAEVIPPSASETGHTSVRHEGRWYERAVNPSVTANVRHSLPCQITHERRAGVT